MSFVQILCTVCSLPPNLVFQELFQKIKFLSTWTTSLQMKGNLHSSAAALHIHVLPEASHFNADLSSTWKKIPQHSQVLARQMAEILHCMLGAQNSPYSKSLGAKLSSVRFTRVCILFSHGLKLWCRKNRTNRLPLVWDLVYSLEKEGMATFISFSKEINHLKVHNNCSALF